MVTCECSCTVETPYADGSLPWFYTDETTAAWMFQQLKAKAKTGIIQHHHDQQHGIEHPLEHYGFYWGVHLDGQHILALERT